jgi:hypothetical protein
MLERFNDVCAYLTICAWWVPVRFVVPILDVQIWANKRFG